MNYKFIRNCLKRYCQTTSDEQKKSFFNKYREGIIAGSILGTLCYSIFYTYKKNNCINVRILPPIPNCGVVSDDAKIEILLEKFGKSMKNSKNTSFYCFYGGLGSGKTTLLRNLGIKLYPDSKNSFLYPKSKILVFLNCSSRDSLIDSLIDFISQLNKDKTESEFYNSLKLDLESTELLDSLMEKVLTTLESVPGFFMVLDNINTVSYKEIGSFFTKYVFNEKMASLKGSVIFVCDTHDPIMNNVPNVYKISGLSLQSAYYLFLKHTKISEDSIQISDPSIKGILHLTHSNPLSLVSFSLMVHDTLKKSPNLSIKQAIKNVEDSVLDRVKNQIQRNNISVTPNSFEYLYSDNTLNLYFEEFYNPKDFEHQSPKISTILSLISPSVQTPETLVNKIMSNLNFPVNATSLADLVPKINEKSSSEPQSYFQSFIHSLSEGKRIFEETKEMTQKLIQMDESNSEIRHTERLAFKNKDSPFINISCIDNQDFLSLHPVIYNILRKKFFKDNYLLYDDKRIFNNGGGSLLSFLFNPSIRLVEIWSSLYDSKSNPESNKNSLKINILSLITDEILNCLAHQDPIRYQNRLKLARVRERHLNFLLNNFKIVVSKADGEKVVLTDKDVKYIMRIHIAMCQIYNRLNMYEHALSMYNMAEEFMKNRFSVSDYRFRDELIELYLSQTESLISKSDLKNALLSLKKLWKMVEPYVFSSYPVASVKLILLILKYNAQSKTPFNKVANIDLICHALKKMNLASMDRSLPMEQLAEDMMETYINFGFELAKNNYFSYAFYLIQEAEKFNREIFKEDKNNRYSPFDKKLFDLKLYFERIRGNVQMVELMKRQLYENLH